jgi:hypothetical protein
MVYDCGAIVNGVAAVFDVRKISTLEILLLMRYNGFIDPVWTETTTRTARTARM